MSVNLASEEAVKSAQDALNSHLREIINWHFSPETGCPFWLDWAAKQDWNPLTEIQTSDDLVRFPHFDGDEWLRYLPHDVWIPKQYEGKPFNIFETGGTTGMPKQRIGWEDYKIDYSNFSESLADEDFPRNEYWLMIGPTGPRRLRLSIEHLANVRGCACYFVDLDPRWVKKLITRGQGDQAKAYMEHVIDQAMTVINNRKVSALFTTPKLLEALGERLLKEDKSIPDVGIKGAFVGGTQMDPQYTRFLIEEVLEDRVKFVPTYGNTLMGLAQSLPVTKENKFSITYHAPQPRAMLRVVDPNDTDKQVEYDAWGRVELTTLTKELFMPRFLERDEAMRTKPVEDFPWDGVGQVRPFGALEKKIVEGVY